MKTTTNFEALVSIIIPVYNVEQFIKDCIISVISQTYRPIEVIIVDDCGIDQSICIAEKILNNSSVPYSVVKHSHNRGLSAARNTGVEYSSGDYIYFLDSDDTLPCEAISNLVSIIQDGNSDIAIGSYEIITNKISQYNNECIHFKSNTYIEPNHLFSEAFGAPATNKLINKKFYIENGISFSEGYVYEDEVWAYLLTCKKPSVVQTQKATYTYIIRENSITKQKELSLNNIRSAVYILEFATQTANENKHLTNEMFSEWYEKRCSSAIIKVLQSKLLKPKDKMHILKRIRSDLFFPVEKMKSSNKIIKYALYLTSSGLPFSFSCILIYKIYTFLSKSKFF